MEYSKHLRGFIGIVFFVFIGLAATTNTLKTRQNDPEVFRDDDHRAPRQKRDESNDTYSTDNLDSTDHVASSIHLEPHNKTDIPDWFQTMKDQKWYGAEFYFNRTLYRRDPDRHPTVCYNNNTRVENNTRVLLYFICPMSHQDDNFVYCCGIDGEQSCCNKEVYDKELIELKEKEKTSNDIDLITGLTIAGACAGCVTICMLLYCCCCQRRPEIHDGIKLMWVRRSFGKELSRLEQPTYPNHLAVVSSRAASRQGSRSGSRIGSHQGSRNPSRGPSPSVSRRASYERSPSRKHKVSASTSERQKLTVDIPSSVVITVTTPSDEHGPTNPLLKSMDG